MTTARGLLARTGLPQRESEVLLLSLLGRDRGWLFAHGDAPIAQHCEGAFMEWVQRRQKGEPLAYILGEREFWSLPLRVTPDVLIPRPDTEVLVEWEKAGPWMVRKMSAVSTMITAFARIVGSGVTP